MPFLGNISALLVNHLRGSGCISYAVDMKVRLPSLDLFYYPDLAVTCDKRDRASDKDFILHPKLIVEVLSDSTEAFDRACILRRDSGALRAPESR